MWFVKTARKTVMVYLLPQRVTGIFNTTGNFTSYHINFLDFRFRKSSDFSEISGGSDLNFRRINCRHYHALFGGFLKISFRNHID